ncbi:MAG TPA: cupin domain-containing protein [Gaiellaceae bacterium]
MKVYDLWSRELAPGVELVPFGRLREWGQAVELRVAPGGVLPGHEAGASQLFVVVRGRGWVRSGEDGERVRVDEGQAVLFEQGEWHESGSDEWMTAVVLECGAFEPAQPVQPGTDAAPGG